MLGCFSQVLKTAAIGIRSVHSLLGLWISKTSIMGSVFITNCSVWTYVAIWVVYNSYADGDFCQTLKRVAR